MPHRIPLDNLTSDQLDALYQRLDRARDAAALHRRGLIATAELYAVIEAQPEPLTDAEGRTICVCTIDTPCGCGTSAHYRPEPAPAATEATEPATITDPAHLRNLYASALYERERPPRDPHWPDAYASDREVFEAMADAVMHVRDRHIEQLRHRLQLAQATLNDYAEADSADAAAGSYALRAETAEQQRDQLAATLREALAVFGTEVRDQPGSPAVAYLAEHPIHPDDMGRWQTTLDAVVNPKPAEPVCARCKGRGIVPNWQDWDGYHGEPRPKPCPDCTTLEDQ